MRLGIFAKTFVRSSLESVFDAVVDRGFHSIQFNFESTGLDPLPASIPDAVIERVRRASASRAIEITALSGTFNMIHPDLEVVALGLERLEVLADAARPIGAEMITLCTGTFDRESMWRRHPDNDSERAWQALLDSMEQALAIAVRRGVTLGVEPEPGNVINSAEKCRRLLDEFASPLLKVIFDPANLVSTDLARDPGELLTEAFDMLGHDIVVGHGKDCGPNGEIVPAGRGIVPWDLVADRMSRLPGSARLSLVIHGIDEPDVDSVRTYLQAQIDAAG